MPQSRPARRRRRSIPPDARPPEEVSSEYAACAASLFRRYIDDAPPPGGIARAGTCVPQASPRAADDRAVEEALRMAPPRQRRRRRGGWHARPRLDLPRVLRAQAEGHPSTQVWQRREETRPGLAAVLLVDLSGSMTGEKIEAAIAATAVLLLALTRIPSIAWSVLGFQDVLIPVIPFDDPTGPQTQVRIGACATR